MLELFVKWCQNKNIIKHDKTSLGICTTLAQSWKDFVIFETPFLLIDTLDWIYINALFERSSSFITLFAFKCEIERSFIALAEHDFVFIYPSGFSICLRYIIKLDLCCKAFICKGEFKEFWTLLQTTKIYFFSVVMRKIVR